MKTLTKLFVLLLLLFVSAEAGAAGDSYEKALRLFKGVSVSLLEMLMAVQSQVDGRHNTKLFLTFKRLLISSNSLCFRVIFLGIIKFSLA